MMQQELGHHHEIYAKGATERIAELWQQQDVSPTLVLIYCFLQSAWHSHTGLCHKHRDCGMQHAAASKVGMKRLQGVGFPDALGARAT